MESLNIMSWNIRGIGNEVARRNLLDHIRLNRVGIICIQETKKEVWSRDLEIFLDKFVSYKKVFQPARGLSGGLATIWDSRGFVSIALAQSNHWIWNTFQSQNGGGKFHVVNIYSPLKLDSKRLLWKDIKDIIECIGLEPFCIIGDFNSVRTPEERLNCSKCGIDSREFNDLIKDHNLLDIKMINASYTWFGSEGRKSRLDRALLNGVWFQTAIWEIKALCRKHSDHKPILLYSGNNFKAPRPFKLFNYHLKEALLDKIKKLVKGKVNWCNLNIHQALKEVNILIKEFTKGNNSQMDKEILQLESKLEELEESRAHTKEHTEVKERLQELYSAKESMLRQKSRLKWLRLGDGNTKFYHQTIQRRISKNRISKIYWGNKWVADPEGIQKVFFLHFSKFFQNNGSTLLDIGELVLPRLSVEDSKLLSEHISEKEIENALAKLQDDKAPGPDGYNIRSLKILWPFFGPKLCHFIDTFSKHSILPQGVNSSFIVLVPKNSNPQFVKDFRPISLINSSIKVLLKVLALRLASKMNLLISDSQFGFIKGRQASESILLLKEIAHSIQKRNCKGCILKLDFEKAFDTVNWRFLIQVMQHMSFDSKWYSWIHSILDSAKVSVLVNGVPTKEFKPNRGLRQGDPISPLLYNLVGEALNSMLVTASRKGIFKGITLKKGMDQITHLQFADDTVIFLDGSIELIKGIKKVLQCFQIISGLKVNFEKSDLFAKSADCNLLEGSSILKCKIDSWPMKYLGTPIGSSPRKQVFWAPLIQKMSHKLAKWKADCLNMAGRMVLVKSVLDGLPTYWMSIHQVPPSVVKQIEQIRRNFLWGHYSSQDVKKRRLHLVSWNKICRPKCQGGLGLVPVKLKNLALLSKWFFRWEKEKNRCWNRWIRDKYNFSLGDGLAEGLAKGNTSDCLKGFTGVLNHPAFRKNLLHKSFSWQLGNGISILF